MLHYWLLLRERHPDARLVQHVLYIGDPALTMTRYIEDDTISYRYEITDIRDFDEEVFLQSGSAADRMLAVLSRMRNERVTIRRILASWAQLPRREREDLIQKLVLFSGLRRLNEIVAEEVNNMPITIDPMENSTIRGWVEAGIAQGIQQQLPKRLKEAQELMIEHDRASLLTKQLTKRFGTLPAKAKKKLQSAHSDQLERWALRLLDAATLDEVLAD